MWLHYIAEAITAIASIIAAVRSTQSHSVAKSALSTSEGNARVINDIYTKSVPP